MQDVYWFGNYIRSIGLCGSMESKDYGTVVTMEDDSPITKASEDALDRLPFAKNLAAALFPDGSDTECRVIGLIGKWGCGKTSIVNITKEILKGELVKKENRGNALNIIDFNPWQYTGNDDLIKPFLNEVAYGLKDRGLKVWGLKRKIASYSRKLDYEPVKGYAKSTFDAVVEFVGCRLAVFDGNGNANIVFNTFKGWLYLIAAGVFGGLFLYNIVSILHSLFSTKICDDKLGAQDYKDEVNEYIKKKHIHLLIVIDDVDRLTSEEALQIFRIVRTNADFANTTYLLCFDKDVVIELVNKANNSDSNAPFGDEFIEKIINTEFSVPNPPRFLMRAHFRDKITSTMKDFGAKKEPDDMRVEKLVDLICGAQPTMRDLKRYINALLLHKNIIAPGGVPNMDVADFIALEYIREKDMDFYNAIYNNKVLLTSEYDARKQNGWEIKDMEEKLAAITNGSEEREKFLELLFPNVCKGMYFEDSGSVVSSFRVCKRNAFDGYFQKVLTMGDDEHIFLPELRDFIGKQSSKNDMCRFIAGYCGTKRFSILLEVLLEVCGNGDFIERKNAPHFIAAMFDLDSAIPNDQRNVFTSVYRGRVDAIIDKYVKSVLYNPSSIKKCGILLDAMEEAESIFSIASFTHRVEENFSEIIYDMGSLPLTDKNGLIAKMKNLCAKKMHDKFINDNIAFWNGEYLFYVINYWHEFDKDADKNSFDNAMRGIVQDDKKFARLMVKLYRQSKAKGYGSPYEIARLFPGCGDKEQFEKMIDDALPSVQSGSNEERALLNAKNNIACFDERMGMTSLDENFFLDDGDKENPLM